MKTTIVQILLIGAATVVGAQDRIAGPVSGFVFDGLSHALRPILGIPGASTLGDAVTDAGANLSAAYVSPGQDLALVVASDGPRFIRVNGGTVSAIACDGLVTPESMAFSPSGKAVALYAGGRILVFAGLPDAPTLSGALDVAVLLRSVTTFAAPRVRRGPAATINAFAISDDGRYVLVSAGGSLRLLGIAGENFTVANAGAKALAAFAPGGHRAAVATAGGAVLLFEDVASGGAARSLASPDGGEAAPVGLAFSADGRKLFLAVSGARSVAAFDPASGTRSSIVCHCEPAGLTLMGGLLRLNEAGAEPLWLLDARSDAPRLVFVPARSE